MRKVFILIAGNIILLYGLAWGSVINEYPTGVCGAIGIAGPTGIKGSMSIGTGSSVGNTPYWDGTEWVVNSNNLFNNGSRIGIGDVNPQQKLSVIGSTNIRDGRFSFKSNSYSDVCQFHGMFYDMMGGYKGFVGMNKALYNAYPYDSLRMSMIIFDTTETTLIKGIPFFERYWGLRVKVSNNNPGIILSNTFSAKRGVDVGLYVNGSSVLLRSTRGCRLSKIGLDTNSMALYYSFSRDSADHYYPRFAVDTSGNVYIRESLGVNLFSLSKANSSLQVKGSVSSNVVKLISAASPYTVRNIDFSVFFETGDKNCTVNLPSAKNCLGRIYIIKKTDKKGSGSLTVFPASTEKIDGDDSYVIPASSVGILRIQSDGTDWQTW